ncbi:hypothetical protein Tco_1015829 [Tanacetum coccineum]|uniref:Uncharacterized protein n=1 Tax=Tanacetum coccineum TaxID=301880 RepID=A0ABQ5FME1_9ASTR
MGGMGSRSMGSGSKGLGFRLVFPNEHVFPQRFMMQRYVEDPSIDIPFIFDIDGRTLELGRQDFCLITGFSFQKLTPTSIKMNEPWLKSSLEFFTKVTTANLATRGSSSSRSVHTCVRKEVRRENGNGSISVQVGGLYHQSTEGASHCMYSEHLDKNWNDVSDNHLVDGLDQQSVEAVNQVTSVNKDLAEESESAAIDGLISLQSHDIHSQPFLSPSRQILFLAVLTWIIWTKMVALLMLKLWLDLSYDIGDSVRLVYPLMSCHRPPLKLNARKAFNYQKANIKKIIKSVIGADGNEIALLPWNEDLTRSPNAPKRSVSVPEEIISLFRDKKKMEMQWTFPWLDDGYTIQMDFWERLVGRSVVKRLVERCSILVENQRSQIMIGQWQIHSDMLSRYELPLYYADGIKYGVPWFASGVEKVYFLVNEKDFHWCLVELHIRSDFHWCLAELQLKYYFNDNWKN